MSHNDAQIRRAVTSPFRPVIGSGLDVSGKVLGSTGLSSPWANASKQIAAASRHLDKLLKDADDNNIDVNDNRTVNYIEKVESYKNAVMGGGLQLANLTPEQWEEVLIAADASKRVYEAPYRFSSGIVIDENWSGSIKRALLSTSTPSGKKMIIVALRGSVTLADWVINLDHGVESTVQTRNQFALNPELPSKLADSMEDISSSAESGLVLRRHPGLYAVALNMQHHICAQLVDMLAAEPEKQTILFTGHSAGGAVAQFLYDIGQTLGTELNNVLGDGRQVDCITFAAPPIANPPIEPRFSSLFISVINEGDPVPLLEPDYAYTLLNAYVSAKPREPTRLLIPPRMLGLSGTCIVLKDDSRGDPQRRDIAAYTAKNEDFAQVLFGNFVMHKMELYWQRVSSIEQAARVAIQTP